MDMKRLGEYVLGLYAAMFDDVAVEFPALRAEFERDCKRLSCRRQTWYSVCTDYHA